MIINNVGSETTKIVLSKEEMADMAFLLNIYGSVIEH
jgi:hypothetical protein